MTVDFRAGLAHVEATSCTIIPGLLAMPVQTVLCRPGLWACCMNIKRERKSHSDAKTFGRKGIYLATVKYF